MVSVRENLHCLPPHFRLQRSRIAKGSSDVPFDFILGGKIELLEERRRDRDTSGCPDFVKCCLAALILTQMEMAWVVLATVVVVPASVTIYMIFLDVGHIVRNSLP